MSPPATRAELRDLIASLELAPRDQVLTLEPPVIVDGATLAAWFPDHFVLPPPPPGYGPVEASGVFVANRPWGQLWFAQHTGDRIVHITVAPGRHLSPGV